MSATERAIAIVDDDASVCESTRFLLETYDFDVRAYRSGVEFLRDDPVIACLIIDYHMPEMDGLEVVSELRRRGRFVPTIIMITAVPDAAIERVAAEIGVWRVLRKPLSNRLLLAALRERFAS
jgi:two-component system response regulator FixJ